MSWNLTENRIPEDKVDELDLFQANHIKNNWKTVYNPITKKTIFINPKAYTDLRKALLSTIRYQPETIEEQLIKNNFN